MNWNLSQTSSRLSTLQFLRVSRFGLIHSLVIKFYFLLSFPKSASSLPGQYQCCQSRFSVHRHHTEHTIESLRARTLSEKLIRSDLVQQH
jgi:hypothetical protein